MGFLKMRTRTKAAGKLHGIWGFEKVAARYFVQQHFCLPGAEIAVGLCKLAGGSMFAFAQFFNYFFIKRV